MTLTEAARLSRKFAFWVVVVILLFIFIRASIEISLVAFRFFFPKPTPPPTVAFGKLTPYDFSQNSPQNSGEVSYIIKTIEGSLPNLGDRAEVFQITKKAPTILFGEQARQQAKILGFTSEPQTETENLYIFSLPDFPERKLQLDVVSGNFKITDNINSYPELLSMVGQLNEESAVRFAKNFLSQNNRLEEDFTDEKITKTPLKIEGGELVKAKSLSEAHIIRVGFGREDLNKMPILPVNAEKPNVWVDVTPNRDRRIFQAAYFYHSANLKSSASYPIKTTKAAFDELVKGEGILIGEKAPELEIRRVFLAYLETAAPMDFFIPVYVFSGDNFTAFVTAVPAEWFK